MPFQRNILKSAAATSSHNKKRETSKGRIEQTCNRISPREIAQWWFSGGKRININSRQQWWRCHGKNEEKNRVELLIFCWVIARVLPANSQLRISVRTLSIFIYSTEFATTRAVRNRDDELLIGYCEIDEKTLLRFVLELWSTDEM